MKVKENSLDIKPAARALKPCQDMYIICVSLTSGKQQQIYRNEEQITKNTFSKYYSIQLRYVLFEFNCCYFAWLSNNLLKILICIPELKVKPSCVYYFICVLLTIQESNRPMKPKWTMAQLLTKGEMDKYQNFTFDKLPQSLKIFI